MPSSSSTTPVSKAATLSVVQDPKMLLIEYRSYGATFVPAKLVISLPQFFSSCVFMSVSTHFVLSFHGCQMSAHEADFRLFRQAIGSGPMTDHQTFYIPESSHKKQTIHVLAEHQVYPGLAM